MRGGVGGGVAVLHTRDEHGVGGGVGSGDPAGVGVGVGVAEPTVRTASLLVTLPAWFETLTRNRAPLSPVGAEGRVYVEFVAPLIFAPLRCHW